jgi:hypothetical protein
MGWSIWSPLPLNIEDTYKIKITSGLKPERSFTFLTHAVEDVQIVGVQNLGDDTFEVTYKMIFQRVKADYMKHMPQRSDPEPKRTVVWAKLDDEWKIQ